jgi:hypothetical protein
MNPIELQGQASTALNDAAVFLPPSCVAMDLVDGDCGSSTVGRRSPNWTEPPDAGNRWAESSHPHILCVQRLGPRHRVGCVQPHPSTGTVSTSMTTRSLHPEDMCIACLIKSTMYSKRSIPTVLQNVFPGLWTAIPRYLQDMDVVVSSACVRFPSIHSSAGA